MSEKTDVKKTQRFIAQIFLHREENSLSVIFEKTNMLPHYFEFSLYLRNKRSSAKIWPVHISLLSIYIKTLWFNCFNGKKNQICVSQKFKAKLKLKFHMYILSEDYIGIFIYIFCDTNS